nr:hypothetical protein [Nocardia vinacea]
MDGSFDTSDSAVAADRESSVLSLRPHHFHGLRQNRQFARLMAEPAGVAADALDRREQHLFEAGFDTDAALVSQAGCGRPQLIGFHRLQQVSAMFDRVDQDRMIGAVRNTVCAKRNQHDGDIRETPHRGQNRFAGISVDRRCEEPLELVDDHQIFFGVAMFERLASTDGRSIT